MLTDKELDGLAKELIYKVLQNRILRNSERTHYGQATDGLAEAADTDYVADYRVRVSDFVLLYVHLVGDGLWVPMRRHGSQACRVSGDIQVLAQYGLGVLRVYGGAVPDDRPGPAEVRPDYPVGGRATAVCRGGADGDGVSAGAGKGVFSGRCGLLLGPGGSGGSVLLVAGR